MSKRMRILRNGAIGLVGLILLLAAGGVLTVRTQWFRDYVKKTIITATEERIGGRVEIGSFEFTWAKLHAVVTDFVIHGNEPAGSDPFARAGRVELDLRLFTSLKHLFQLAYLGVDKPQINVVALPDGRTNIPTPKLKSTSDQTAAEIVVDLAIGHFELTNGLIRFNSQQQPLDVRGNNLRAQFWYKILERGYRGLISMQPLYVVSGRNTPVNFTVSLPVAIQGDRIEIDNARISTAASEIVINGSVANLRNPKTTAHISGHVAMADLNNLADLPPSFNARRLPSTFELTANASLVGNAIQVTGLRLSAFGGEIEGNASLENMARYNVKGNLRQLDLAAMAWALGEKDLPYSASASGPIEVEGDLQASGTKSVTANARLVIAPGRKGIPMSGHLNANYEGATNSVSVSDSYIALPHTRLALSGTLGNRLNISLSSRNLNDLLAPMASAKPTIKLSGGVANFAGVVTGRLASLDITGHLKVDPFSVAGRQFDLLTANVNVSPSAAAIVNGRLTRSAMEAQFAATIGLKNWRPTPNQRLSADVSMQNGDLADILAMAGQSNASYSGALNMNAHVTGTVGNPSGTGNLVVLSGMVLGEPFDRIEAQVKMADQLIAIPAAYVSSGRARIDLTGEFQHPRDSLSKGSAHLHIQSNQVELSELRSLLKEWPDTAGQVQLQADVTGDFGESKSRGSLSRELRLTSVNAEAAGRNLRLEGESYGDFSAKVRTSGRIVNYNVASDFAGSNIRVSGNTQLAPGYPTNAETSLSKLPIERLLSLAKRTDIPARGIVSGTARIAGTIEKPEASLDMVVTDAVLYDEPVDRIKARLTYLAQSVDVPQFEIVSGASRIDLTAHYDHPAGNLQAGSLQFKLNSSRLDLTPIRALQKARPGLGGVLQIAASGAAVVSEKQPRVLVRDLNANLSASAIKSNGKSFGDLKFGANTAAGGRLNFTLNSNLASGAIEGHGNAELNGDYPVNAQVAFSNVTWTGVRGFVGSAGTKIPDFDAVTDGQITVAGPLLKTADLNGSLEITRFQFSTIPNRSLKAKPVVIQNQGPIAASLQRGVARITSLHLTGAETDIQASGTVSLQDQTVSASLNATTNLSLLQGLDRDVSSSGSVAVIATVRGTASTPLVNGRLELHNASIHHMEFPNGISNANGVATFNGNSVSFQNVTAESGGGTLTIGGFAAFRDVLRMGLRVNASNVRVRVQQGVSVVADANLNLTGTMEGSNVSGTVTIDQVNYNPRSDFGALLSSQAAPIQSPATPSPLLDSMRLEIRVRTSDAMAVQASLAQNLQSDADLRIRGTASHPGVLGRVSINEGEIAFFGSTYTVNTGTISFYNPTRIEPVMNISLQTKAKGVEVTLTVNGPIDNMKLSYTSDPPLQFQEIVGLLAAGRTPTSDPTLLANQPSPPPQSFQQMGESALVGKALADPVSSRLQRVFGVSQMKVDPTFTSGSELPQARLTLQQQISTNVTFTYVTALDDPNTQIIRAEWAFTQQWSAIATRDQNGIVSINFYYKKQFR